ncbi:hypothetical protein HDV00_012506 [Rhizophlyctis rosea]|nr:hypothetical protein HDV00_012506 [Rhizophlyctis rosea]
MARLALFLLITLATASTTTPTPLSSTLSHPKCKCLPTSSCWPSPQTWSTLNKTVENRLIAVRPPAYPCHNSTYNAAQCAEVQENWSWGAWRMNQPGALWNINWETGNEKDRCPIDNSTLSEPCRQGNVVSYAVNATKADHVIEAVNFAIKNNVRLVVKNTGHDYIGRSTTKGALSVWTHYMKSIVFADGFVAEGCKKVGEGDEVVTVGAGSRWGEPLKLSPISIGFAASVGASGGYVLGGGHSILSPTHGLAIDNILQFTLVMPTGKLITASSCQNTDIFWALRGGGGGFGILLSTTHKLHADQNATAFQITATANSTEAFEGYVEKWVELMLTLSAYKFSGYFYQIDTMLVVPILLTTSLDIPKLSTLLSPVLSPSQNITIDTQILISYTSTLPIFQQLAESLDEPGGPESVLLGSRLIPQHLFETKPKQTASTLLTLAPSSAKGTTVIWHLVAGNAVATPPKRNPTPGSINPAWRHALLHIAYAQSLPSVYTDAEYKALSANVTAATEKLKRLAPDSGCYINESDAYEKGWIQSKYGANYARLKSIKKKVDPFGVLVCRQCVGWEEWDGEGVCRV